MYLSLKYRFYATTAASLVFIGAELMDTGHYFGLLGYIFDLTN